MRALALVMLALVLAGCGGEGHSGESADPASASSGAGSKDRSFQVKGVVRGVKADEGVLVVRHDEIPGYMPRMTMELTVLNTNELAGLHVGDAIEFRMVVRSDDHFIDGVRRLAGGAAGDARTESTDAPRIRESDADERGGLMVELKPGDLAPDISIRLETGEEVKLSTWRGNAVALTFFFVRCPLPDFCPRMNRNFQEARAALRAGDGGRTNWLFLSLSFDWDFDQPKVLQSHAPLYRGTNASGWWFGALGPSALAAVKPAFDLSVGREGGSFSHNLRTVVLDPNRRVFRQFDGNRWKADELVSAIRAASEIPATETPAR